MSNVETKVSFFVPHDNNSSSTVSLFIFLDTFSDSALIYSFGEPDELSKFSQGNALLLRGTTLY